MNALTSLQQFVRYGIGLAIWLLGWCLLLFFDTRFDPVNLSLILVLTSALAAMTRNARLFYYRLWLSNSYLI